MADDMPKKEPEIEQLAMDLSNLIDDKETANFVFKVEDEEIFAHKEILAGKKISNQF
jgi:hypothetical protein